MIVLELFNTLTRQKNEIIPFEEGLVRMYTCGPTVYRDAHIGNLRSYLMADWIKRSLIILGYEVIHIKNITDVGHMRQEVLERGEDKVVAAAIASGQTPQQIADFYTQRFLNDEKTLNILPADEFPKATDHITEMIKIVEQLEKNKLAYEVEGNLYFNVRNFDKYGQLSGNIHENTLKDAIRVEIDPLKKDPRDFTLWKKAEEGRLLKWNSPWGYGFPGWHIECSAMSIKYLGKNIDIHTGGVDNIFPHHEGEIAQSEGFTGRKVVNHWVHGQHLLADGVKMAKSSGNAYLISDLINRGIDPLAFRYLCMTARYRTRINFTFASLKASENALNKLKIKFHEFRRSSHTNQIDTEKFNAWKMKFQNSFSDDLNMPEVLNLVWRLLESELNPKDKYELLIYIDQILGFDLPNTNDSFEIPDDILNICADRTKLRAQKQFKKSDDIRTNLESSGYIVQDYQYHSILRKKSLCEIRNERWPTISSSSQIQFSNNVSNKIDFTVALLINSHLEDAERCILSVNKFSDSKNFEILALDNGCDEATGEALEIMSKQIPALSIIHADHSLGDGAAKNILIKKSSGKIFILLDTSVEITGEFLNQINLILSDTSIGIAGFAGLKTSDLNHFHDGDGESGEMDAMQGYCFAFRRDDVSQVGLMRESFRFYRNLDIDYSFQFKEKGYKIFADHNLPMVLHEHRGWTSLVESERDELSRKNYGRFLKKWRNRSDLLISERK